MIQFNLLPSVKQEFVKAKRNKRMTLLVAAIIASSAVAIMVILFLAVQVSKKHSSDLSADIKTQSEKLENTPNLDKILTVQNQLASLPALHDQKPVATRLLGYVKQVTPAKASISDMEIDYELGTMKISGSADVISTVNTYVDTIKFTTYKTESGEEGNAFSDVVLSDFSKEEDKIKYEISFKYTAAIFLNDNPVTITVPPGKVTTRSETERPEPLFQTPPNTNDGGQ